MRYFIRISYNGKKYHGWQIQENANTVQAELNRALALVLRMNEIETVGCGRTDTGVHAKQFYLHIDLNLLEDVDKIIHQINAVLPRDIAVHSLFMVDDNAHARFSAISRTYVYRMFHQKNPFLHESSCYFPSIPDVDKMNVMAETLMQHQDFSCFSKSNSQTHTNNCKITHAKWMYENEELVFTITADRFLRNMVRAIVGTLLDGGMNKLSISDLKEILNSKDRSEAGKSVPAHGLYLTDITYPFEVY